MFESVREYAGLRLVELGLEEAARARHRRFYARVARGCAQRSVVHGGQAASLGATHLLLGEDEGAQTAVTEVIRIGTAIGDHDIIVRTAPSAPGRGFLSRVHWTREPPIPGT